MRAEIAWSNPAFAKLEALPSPLAFEIVRRAEVLAAFPEMGLSLRSRYPQLRNCRQLIVSGSYRLVYEFDADASQVYILDLQHCRQQLPSAAELKFRLKLKDELD